MPGLSLANTKQALCCFASRAWSPSDDSEVSTGVGASLTTTGVTTTGAGVTATGTDVSTGSFSAAMLLYLAPVGCTCTSVLGRNLSGLIGKFPLMYAVISVPFGMMISLPCINKNKGA